MGQISLLAIAIVILVVLFVLTLSRREAGKHDTSTGEEFVGICKSAIETASQKEGRKERTLALLSERDPSTSSGYKELSNADIRKELGVSSRTAVRYLDELEVEGRVEQVGNTGKYTRYKIAQF